MEAGGGAGELDIDDWELLQPEADEIIEEGDGAESEGLMKLRLDYFSIDDSGVKSGGLLSEGGGSVESDNPSWIDPASSEAPFPRRDSREFWPDSASDGAKSSVCGDKINQLGFEMENQEEDGQSSVGVEFSGAHEVEETIIAASDYSGEKMDGSGAEQVNRVGEDGALAADVGNVIEKEGAELPAEEGINKVMMWWKLPMELVKYCVFRVSPLWSISVAAAMVGVFIMRRRLQKMKTRTKTLQMKVTVDDQKVDQFMSRAARLNEAFSVVRRVPIIRPPLPGPGVTPWPVMSMR